MTQKTLCCSIPQGTKRNKNLPGLPYVEMNSLLVVVLLVIRGTGSAHADTPTSATANISAPRIFLCSVEEKECFRVNQVLHKEDRKCYLIGNRGPCSRDKEFVVLRDAYMRNGQFLGGCQLLFPCARPDDFVMVDGRCQAIGDSVDICPYDKTKRLKKNIFGEWKCCSPDKCNELPPNVEQPKNEEYCVEPNLTYEGGANPLAFANYSLLDGQFECSNFLETCLRNSSLPVPGNKSCARLLQKCEEGWFVVDRDKFFQNNIISLTCQPPPCSLGWLSLAPRVLGKEGCLSIADIHKMCAGEDVVFNAFGEALCGGAVSQEALLSLPEDPAKDCVRPETEEARPFSSPDDCTSYSSHGLCPLTFCPPCPEQQFSFPLI